MSSNTPTFPLEIIITISQILFVKEHFIELESLIDIFPEIGELYSHAFPTIVVVDTDLYDKCWKFIYTRKRPFGSKDMLIFKQERDAISGEVSKVEPKCYMLLGSKHNQEQVVRGFAYLKSYVTIMEHGAFIDFNSNEPVKFYEIGTHDNEMRTESWFNFEPSKNNSSSYVDSPVAHLLSQFIRYIKPKLVRFESFSLLEKVRMDYQEMYCVYKFACEVGLSDEDRALKDFHEDRISNTPKCSFEFIKKIDKLVSVYQFETSHGSTDLEYEVSTSSHVKSCDSCLKEFWTSPIDDNKLVKIGLFENLKKVTIESVPYNNRENAMITIDCSRSACKGRKVYQLMYNASCHRGSTILRPHNTGTSVGQFRMLNISSDSPKEENVSYVDNINERLHYYVNFLFKNLLGDKLQSVDITAFDPNLLTSFTPFEKESLPKINRFNHYKGDLKALELEINNLLISIKQLNQCSYTKILKQQKIAELSQFFIRTITREILSGDPGKALKNEQPFRFRLFNTNSYAIDNADDISSATKQFNALCTFLDKT